MIFGMKKEEHSMSVKWNYARTHRLNYYFSPRSAEDIHRLFPLCKLSEVNLRNRMKVRKHASEKSTLTLYSRADVTRSPKQGYQWPHKKEGKEACT